jgi:DNA-binding winged helix-turn-helix (wHTH) protein
MDGNRTLPGIGPPCHGINGERVRAPLLHLPSSVLTFGRFRLIPAQRTLLNGGRSVKLGSRALDILIVLARRAGEVVTKKELLACAWPDTLVEEVNLRVNIAALRRILGEGRAGDRYIVSVSGRGYCFVAPVTRVETSPTPRCAEGPRPLHETVSVRHHAGNLIDQAQPQLAAFPSRTKRKA